MYALMKQDYCALESVLGSGGNPNQKVNLNGAVYTPAYLPLSVAGCLDDRRAVEILLAYGADPNGWASDVKGWNICSVLTHAAMCQAYTVVDALLNGGAFVSKSAYYQEHFCAFSPVFYAICYGDVPMLARFLEHLDTHDDGFWIAEYYSKDSSDKFVEELFEQKPAHAQVLQVLLENRTANQILTEWRHSNGAGLRGILESKGWSVLLRAVRDFNTLLLKTDSDKSMMLNLMDCFPVEC